MKSFIRFLPIGFLLLLIVGHTAIAQPYLNGNLSTGVLSRDSITAPPGFTWSQTQFSNRTLGFSASVTSNTTLADNFIVPTGQIWSINGLTVYAYATNYSSTICPFSNIRFKIYDADPTTAGARVLFGDLSTSRSITGTSAKMYRIRDTSNTAREVWSVKTNFSLTLNPGNYWIEWQLANITGVTSCFFPPNTFTDAVYYPTNNGYQHNLTSNTWNFLLDQGNSLRQDLPFRIDYTATFPTPCAGLPNPGNTLSIPSAPCTGQSFTLSLQNNPFVTGLSYQWQSSADSINWIDISGANSSTYSNIYYSPIFYRALVTCGTATTNSRAIALRLPTSFVSVQPINRSAVCSDSIYFSFRRGGTAAVARYQWQQRTTALAAWTNLSNSSTIKGADSDTLKFLIVQTTQNGYQYRAVYVDSCGNRDSTNPATLTVTAIKARITPSSASICLGSTQQLTLNSKPNAIASFSSGSISINIPDSISTGATNSINVSGIPSNAVITGVSAKVNVQHPFIGEIAIALKAPNGNVLNLDYYLSSTGSPASTSGFSNTLFSSNGSKAVGDTTSPFTGTFKADAIINNGPDYPAGPTSVMPNTKTWSSLYSIPNGAWTLGLFDAEIGDQGRLTGWTLDITYSIPGTAVWTSTNPNSMYSNSNATSIYVTGAQAASVWAKPAITSTYSAVISSPNCGTATPTNVIVTVNGNKSLFARDTANVCDTIYTLVADSGFLSYTWNTGDTGRVLTVRNSGTYRCTANEGTCSSKDSVVVRFGNNNLSGTASACEKFTWYGVTYTSSGTYSKALAFDSCSATDTLRLTIRKGAFTSLPMNTCNSYTWKSVARTASGTYIYNYTNAAGCASSDTLYLTLRNSTYNSETRSACDSFRWHDVLYTTGGTYLYNYTNAENCPSTDTLKLTIYYAQNTETVNSCYSYYWHGTNYTQNGKYIYNYVNPSGCPATDTLVLTIRSGTFSGTTTTVCDKLVWNGNTYTQNGTYIYTYFNAYGCASTDTLRLTVKLSTHNVETRTACEQYTWNGATYSTSGTYLYNYINGIGCPSVDTLKLTVRYGTHNVLTTNACDSFLWNGIKYRQSGTYTYNYSNGFGCVSTDTLKLSIYRRYYSETITACDSFIWRGTTYTQSGTYSWANTYPEGCSTVDTIYLTMKYSSHNIETIDTCDYFIWHGVTYRSSGVFLYNYSNTVGCPSVDTLKLTIRYGTYNTDIVAACSSYVWKGSTYTATGTYTKNYVNLSGCPSVDTLKLSIGYNTYLSETRNECDQYSWRGTIYRSAGDYIYYYNNLYGCPSADTLHLTLRSSSHLVESRDVCDSTVWRSTTYKTSGTHLYNYNNVLSCPSTDTLKLIIRLSTHNVSAQNACDSIRWNGSKFTTSGTYTYGYTNGVNCFSVDTLKLTVFYSSHNVISPVSCDSYVWNGNTYSSSGVYTYNYTNTFGCASVDTMRLTIKKSTNLVQTKDTCETYYWRGNTYSASGNYTNAYINLAGCPSVDTLKLTIRTGTHNVIQQNACDSFAWNGSSYRTSGIFTYNYFNTYGCQSTDTLKLTIDSINYWRGTISSAWENPSNWSCGRIPDSSTIVQIIAPVTNYPVISSMAACKKIYTDPETSLIITEGFKLTVFGSQ